MKMRERCPTAPLSASGDRESRPVRLGRREFILALGGAAALPFAVRAQQMPVIGFLSARSAGRSAHLLVGFHKGLKEVGFVEGQNVMIEYRWADGQHDREAAMLQDLVRRPVAVIFAAGSGVALAAKAATVTIPIVFAGGSDPVAIGLVSSLNHPGGNVTGSTIISHAIGAKRLDLLRQLTPNADLIALLVEPDNPSTRALVRDTEAAARAIGLRTVILTANSEPTVVAAFAAAKQQKASALFVGGGPILGDLRGRIVALATSLGIPAMYTLREFVEDGGLMSYGSNFADSYFQAAGYAGKILKGEQPASLPILQPTRFELVINLKAAKNLGLTISDKMIALADGVIE